MNYTKNSAIYSNHSDVTESQFAVIIHELAHIYAPHPVYGSAELYDINFVCYSTPDFQLNNPNNYVYYAICTSENAPFLPVACMRLALLLLTVSYYPAIWLGCKQYPYIPRGTRSYTGKGSKRQLSTSGLTNDSIPIIDPKRLEIDDVAASVLPGLDKIVAATHAKLAALGYDLPLP